MPRRSVYTPPLEAIAPAERFSLALCETKSAPVHRYFGPLLASKLLQPLSGLKVLQTACFSSFDYHFCLEGKYLLLVKLPWHVWAEESSGDDSQQYQEAQ